MSNGENGNGRRIHWNFEINVMQLIMLVIAVGTILANQIRITEQMDARIRANTKSLESHIVQPEIHQTLAQGEVYFISRREVEVRLEALEKGNQEVKQKVDEIYRLLQNTGGR